jgi:hypothetical protein
MCLNHGKRFRFCRINFKNKGTMGVLIANERSLPANLWMDRIIKSNMKNEKSDEYECGWVHPGRGRPKKRWTV